MLASEDAYAYLTPEAAALLAERRDALGRVVAPGHPGVEIADNEIRWWTFAGGRINTTLRYGLGTLLAGVQIVPDNFLLRLRGDDLTFPRFQDAVAALRSPAVWDDEEHVERNLRFTPGLSPQQVPAAHAALGRAGSHRPVSPRCGRREAVARRSSERLLIGSRLPFSRLVGDRAIPRFQCLGGQS